MIALEFHAFNRHPWRLANGDFRQWSWGFITVTHYSAGGIDTLIDHLTNAGAIMYVRGEAQAYRDSGGRLQ